MSSANNKIKKQFPFDEPRKISEKSTQLDLIGEIVYYLYSKDYDNVIIDAPTGVGKSVVNVTVAKMIEGDTFYVTPQKKLREQLQNDEVLSKNYVALRGREDYRCGVTGQDCSSCDINQDPRKSCMKQDKCTYWNNKQAAMSAEQAVLTFAYLVIDGSIPVHAGPDAPQISFDDRDLLIVDECHNLEDQVASLFAGFMVSPWILPLDVFDNATRKLDLDNTTRHYQVVDVLEQIKNNATAYISQKKGREDDLNQDEARGVEQCEKFLDKVEWFEEEVEHGRDWVVDMEVTEYGNKRYKAFKLKPVKVDKYLRNFVWNRGEKRILSTATMPYRGNPDKWQKQIGLPGKTHVIRVGMPFDKGNRPIHTDTMLGSMSNGGIDDKWDSVMGKINELAAEHPGQKGLIHCASYDRAEKFWKDARNYDNLKDNVVFDRREENTDYYLEDWQDSDKQIFVSPSCMEGVDLDGDKCRWQVLMKVPFPSPGEPRTEYLLNELPHIGWDYYYETTANAVIQSVGRAVRSKDDYADYYILDSKFNDLREKVTMPDWFLESIDVEANHGKQESALSW